MHRAYVLFLLAVGFGLGASAQEFTIPENVSDLTRESERSTPWRDLDPRDPVPILAHYYLWFNPGSWDRVKSDYPALGRYASDDPDVLQQHISMAKEAGIDGFIVSWKSTFENDRRLALLIDEAERQDFSLWLTYQALDFDRKPLPIDVIENDLHYFIETFAHREPFAFFDRPIVLLTGTWHFSRLQVAAIVNSVGSGVYLLATERSTEGYQRIADVVDGNAYYWSSADPARSDYQERLDTMSAAVHASGGLWIAPAAPGFDARLLGGTSLVERLDGDTLRRQLDGALRSSPDAVGLISWNEFSENTHIEPSEVYGNRALEVLADRELALPPIALDFDSSEPGTTSRRGLRGIAVIAALLALVAASVGSVYVRNRQRERLRDSPP
jgi:hypothetical protein